MYRVNWRQRVRAKDRLVRVHRILQSQPPGCRFSKMANDYDDFKSLARAISALKGRGLTEYKRCIHCWDDKVVKI